MCGRNRWVAGNVALAVMLVMTCRTAEAQVTKPFKVSGAGFAPDGVLLTTFPHWAVGNATHLGKYYSEGAVIPNLSTLEFHGDGSITAEFGSAVPCVFNAANGDILACHYGRTDVKSGTAQSPGTVEFVPVGGGFYVGVFIAEFVPVAELCTGRFAGAGGSWIMYAQTVPFVLGSTDPVAFHWEGQGSLTFPKGK